MEKNKVKFGIRAKLMVFVLPIAVIAFALLIVIAFISSRSSIREKTESLLEAEGIAGANGILAWKNENFGILDDAVNTMVNLGMSDEEILEYEAYYLEEYEDFPYGIYIICADGKALDASGWEPEGDLTTGSWYLEAKAHEVFAFGEPYLDDYTNEYVVTVSRFIADLGGREAVAAADISLAILSETIKNLEVVGDGDAFIIDGSSGYILAHRDSGLVGKSVEELDDSFYGMLFNQIAAGNTATGSYGSNDGTYMVSIQPISGTGWYIISRALEHSVYKDIYILGTLLAAVGIVVIAVLSLLIAFEISRITKPIRRLTDTIVMVTEGDFTADIAVSGSDEVAVMTRSMKQFLSVMRDTLGSFARISGKIDGQAKESSQISGKLLDSANGQAEAMKQMRENLEELVKSINEIAENAGKLAAVVADTNEEGNQVLDNFRITINDADTGRDSMESVTASMNQMKEGMEALEASVTDVGVATVKIDEITSTIRNIAEQTDLLALNASIEAARAGEAGKGFAVVATEIKQLAETSSQAVDEISELISSVTDLIHDTVEQSHSSMERIQQSTDLVHRASGQFNKIFESIGNTNVLVNEIIRKINEVNDVAANMAAITEEQSASAEEIEATAVNIQGLADIVADNSASVKDDSAELAVMADDLKEHISKFTI